MQNKISSQDFISSLTPTSLRGYVESLGWTRIKADIPDYIAVYRNEQFPDEEIVVPQKPNFVDFRIRITEALTLLSSLEQRPIDKIVKEVLTYRADVIRFSVDTPDVRDGSIPLMKGIDLVEASRRAILSSACQVIQPQRFHPRLSRSEAEDFLEECRLGQTEKGSFVISVVCPIEALNAEPMQTKMKFIQDHNFTRSVTSSLMLASDKLVKAIDQDQTDALLSESDENSLVNANLCEAIAKMEPSMAGASLRISVQWAKTFPPLAHIPSEVSIRKDLFPVIEDLAVRLKPAPIPKTDTFVARIDMLNGKPDNSGIMSGEVVLVWLDEDNVPIRAKVDLSVDDYASACDAHKTYRHIRLRGTLLQRSRQNRILDYSDFQLIS